MKVIKWIHPDKINEKIEKESTYGLPYYTSYYKNKYKEIEEYNDFYEDAIVKELVDNKYIICGDTHQYMCLPVFENDEYVMLSMRKWGEVMAKAMNLIEGSDKYQYIDFYLVSLCKKEEKLPIK